MQRSVYDFTAFIVGKKRTGEQVDDQEQYIGIQQILLQAKHPAVCLSGAHGDVA